MKKTKNKEGFTLVELLAVIVLLALILVIATTTVTKTIKSNRAKAFSNNMVSVTESVKTILSGNNGIEKEKLIDELSKNLSCKTSSGIIECDQFKIQISDNYGGYSVVIFPSDNVSNKFKNMDKDMFLNDNSNVKDFIYYVSSDISQICAVFNSDGSIVKGLQNINDCDPKNGKYIVSSLDKPSIGNGDSPTVTSVSKPSSPDIKVSSKKIEQPENIIGKSFSCCPANDSDGGFHENEKSKPPYYRTVNGNKYCINDWANYSPLKDNPSYRVSYLEGRKSFVGVGALGEKWFGKDENIYATMMCTPKYGETNYSFGIKEILSGIGYSDASTVDECIAKGYCIKLDNIKRDIKKLPLGSDVYGIVSRDNLRYNETKKEYKNCRWKKLKKVCDVYTYENMYDSYSILLFDKKKVKTENGVDTVKELYFAFLVSDNEWERKINNVGLIHNATPYREQISVFNYDGRKYKVDLFEQTENGLLFGGYGLE